MKEMINWNEITEQVKDIIKSQVTEIIYKTWVEDIKFNNYKDGIVTVKVTEIQKLALKDRLTNNNKNLHQALIETFNELTKCVNDIDYILSSKGANYYES